MGLYDREKQTFGQKQDKLRHFMTVDGKTKPHVQRDMSKYATKEIQINLKILRT